MHSNAEGHASYCGEFWRIKSGGKERIMTFFKKLSNGRGLPIAKLRLLWYRMI